MLICYPVRFLLPVAIMVNVKVETLLLLCGSETLQYASRLSAAAHSAPLLQHHCVRASIPCTTAMRVS